MTRQKYYFQQDFSELIEFARSTLRCSFLEVKNKYNNYPICLMYYIEKNTEEDIIEVRFDNKKATLSCVFDKDATCKSAYIFLDSLEFISECVEYLNANYRYNYVDCRWELPDCCLSINKTEDDICIFIFCK